MEPVFPKGRPGFPNEGISFLNEEPSFPNKGLNLNEEPGFPNEGISILNEEPGFSNGGNRFSQKVRTVSTCEKILVILLVLLENLSILQVQKTDFFGFLAISRLTFHIHICK